MKYYQSIQLQTSFEQAIGKVSEALRNEGFGIISEIDMQEKFKEKLNIDFRKYRILGACNPAYAYKALQKEDKIGTMLPCNVIVQELEENRVEIAAVDPMASMMAIKNDELIEIAFEVKNKLIKVMDSLSK